MQIHRSKHLTRKQSSRILMQDRDRSIGAKICSQVQGAIWEASVHRESKDRPFMHLLPVPPLLSGSHQTSPPSSHPFPPTSASPFTRVLLTSTTAVFLRLQACLRHWLLHSSLPPFPACLEKQSEKDLYSRQKSTEKR